MIVGVFVGIENNISICYKFQNDFNDYFQDKNNKNINDYKSIYKGIYNNDINKNKNSKDYEILIIIDKNNLMDDSIDKYVNLFRSIKNNIRICIVEVPNETAPSIQGFAKPPA